MLETPTLSASEQAHLDTQGDTPIEATTPAVENTEVTPEVQETGDDKPQVEDISQKTVPLQALREARQQLKELKERERIGSERLNQLAQIVQQRIGQPQQQQPEIPAVEVDPVAHFKAKTEALERQLRELTQPVQQMTQQQVQQAQIAQLQAHVSRQEAEFARETPDYGDALKFVQGASFNGLKALGYDDQTAQGLVYQEYLKLAHNIASQGGDVPSRIYEIARANGYKAGPVVDAKQKLEQQRKGVAAAQSLGSGGNVVNGLSLKALAEMSPDEFAKATADESVWRKLMGGR